MEEKKNVVAKASRELTDDEIAGVSGGRKYPIPGEDSASPESGIYDPIPVLPEDFDPSVLHW